MRRVPFNAALAVFALAGLALRVLYGETATYNNGPGDDDWYHHMANYVADGHGFNVPLHVFYGTGTLSDFSGETVPTALHPPLFPILLSVGSKAGLTSAGAHQVLGCAMGAATVVVIGLIGLRLGGRALGLASAALAAVYLPLVANESALLSESLSGLTIALTMLAALRYVDAPTWRRAALLGVAIGAAALTRSETVLLLAILVPLVVRRAGVAPLRHAAVVAGVTIVAIAPWCVRNTAAFDRPVGITTGDGITVAGSNSYSTYYGDVIGAWDFGSTGLPLPVSERLDEAEDGARLRRKGLRYARRHPTRVPVVMAARVGRTWSVYPLDPVAKVRYVALAEGRRKWAEWPTMVMAWAVMLLAVAGAVALRRRGVWLAPLWAPIVLVTVVAILFYGSVRFREPADVSLVLLGAAGLLDLVARLRARRRAPAAAAPPPGP